MFRLEVLHNQWLLISFAGGLVTLIAVVLTYLMLWQPRLEEQKEEKQYKKTPPIPWILWLTYIASFVYAIWFAIVKSMDPPNW